MEQTSAILLRKTPWSETSLIVAWLTERFGTVRTVARGARRPKSPFAGTLDLFYGADISFSINSKGDLHTLREVSLKTVFDVSGVGSAGFYLASYFGELAGIAAPSMQPAPGIFDLLQRGINYVQRAPVTLKALNHFRRPDDLGDFFIDALGELRAHSFRPVQSEPADDQEARYRFGNRGCIG